MTRTKINKNATILFVHSIIGLNRVVRGIKMVKGKKALHMTFEEIVEQNERRIHYHIHKLHINDPHQEFYQEGLVAMWNAYENYKPDKGPLATYFNYTIRNRMIDLIRKKTRERENDDTYEAHQFLKRTHGNYVRAGGRMYPISNQETEYFHENTDLEDIKKELTENQWKWVLLFIVKDLSIKEIADREGVSTDAVKSWGREVRRKLRSAALDY